MRRDVEESTVIATPKTLRKRVHTAMVTQMLVGSQVQGSQVGSGNVGSMERSCKRCVKHQIQHMVVGSGAQCKDCGAKHYGCSLMPVREVVGGSGGPLGYQ